MFSSFTKRGVKDRAVAEQQRRRGDVTTYTVALDSTGSDMKDFLTDFYRNVMYKKDDEMHQEMQQHPDTVGKFYNELVPATVSNEDFWQRYYYRCMSLERIQTQLAASAAASAEASPSKNKDKKKQRTSLTEKLNASFQSLVASVSGSHSKDSTDREADDVILAPKAGEGGDEDDPVQIDFEKFAINKTNETAAAATNTSISTTAGEHTKEVTTMSSTVEVAEEEDKHVVIEEKKTEEVEPPTAADEEKPPKKEDNLVVQEPKMVATRNDRKQRRSSMEQSNRNKNGVLEWTAWKRRPGSGVAAPKKRKVDSDESGPQPVKRESIHSNLPQEWVNNLATNSSDIVLVTNSTSDVFDGLEEEDEEEEHDNVPTAAADSIFKKNNNADIQGVAEMVIDNKQETEVVVLDTKPEADVIVVDSKQEAEEKAEELHILTKPSEDDMGVELELEPPTSSKLLGVEETSSNELSEIEEAPAATTTTSSDPTNETDKSSPAVDQNNSTTNNDNNDRQQETVTTATPDEVQQESPVATTAAAAVEVDAGATESSQSVEVPPAEDQEQDSGGEGRAELAQSAEAVDNSQQEEEVVSPEGDCAHTEVTQQKEETPGAITLSEEETADTTQLEDGKATVDAAMEETPESGPREDKPVGNTVNEHAVETPLEEEKQADNTAIEETPEIAVNEEKPANGHLDEDTPEPGLKEEKPAGSTVSEAIPTPAQAEEKTPEAETKSQPETADIVQTMKEQAVKDQALKEEALKSAAIVQTMKEQATKDQALKEEPLKSVPSQQQNGNANNEEDGSWGLAVMAAAWKQKTTTTTTTTTTTSPDKAIKSPQTTDHDESKPTHGSDSTVQTTNATEETNSSKQAEQEETTKAPVEGSKTTEEVVAKDPPLTASETESPETEEVAKTGHLETGEEPETGQTINGTGGTSNHLHEKEEKTNSVEGCKPTEEVVVKDPPSTPGETEILETETAQDLVSETTDTVTSKPAGCEVVVQTASSNKAVHQILLALLGLLLSIVIAVIVLGESQWTVSVVDQLCAPLPPNQVLNINETAEGVDVLGVAPWWVPEPYKPEVFQHLCGPDRIQTKVSLGPQTQWISWLTGPNHVLYIHDLNSLEKKAIVRKQRVQEAHLSPTSLEVTIQSGETEVIPAPWVKSS